MMGTVLMYPDTEFIVLTMSLGTAGDATSGGIRRDEVMQCWDGIPNVVLEFSGINALEELQERDWIYVLELPAYSKYLSDCDAIFTSPSYDTHYEHLLVNRIGLALTRSRAVSLIEYRTASTVDLWASNMKVDITDVYNQKLRMINTFKSQARHGYFSPPALLAFHMDYDARKHSTHLWCEKFRVVKLWVRGNDNV